MRVVNEGLIVLLFLDYPYRPDRAQTEINRLRQHQRLTAAISDIIQWSADHNVNTRAAAAQALGLITEAQDNPKVITALIDLIPDQQARNLLDGEDKTNPDLRTPGQVAAKILGQWEIKEAVPALIKIVANRQMSACSRTVAIQALGKIKDARAIEALNNISQAAEVASVDQAEPIELWDIAQTALQKIYYAKYLRKKQLQNTPT